MKKKKTLLLVFIHGFKGGDDTFAKFPPHLRALLSHALPHLHVLQIQYPKFETRGDLGECVANFKEWLQNKVIDLEVASKTPSPTIDPSVRTILIGHSMGGIVAAETILSIYRDKPLPPQSTTLATEDVDDAEAQVHPSSTWPSIVGLLAFDTPYLGISHGVLAHNAETHIQTVRGAWNTYSSVAGALGLGGGAAEEAGSKEAAKKAASIPSVNDPDVAQTNAWQRWGRYAMYAGAAGAIIAGGAAAYANRAQISEGWGWATGHLEFVGCLAKGAQLEARVKELVRLAGGHNTSTAISTTNEGKKSKSMDPRKNGEIEKSINDQRQRDQDERIPLIGWANMYTQLGTSAGTLKWNDDGTSGTANAQTGWAHIVSGSDRTFCMLPPKESSSSSTEAEQKGAAGASAFWEPTINDKANNEITAHMHMFTPKDNPGYYGMSERAKEKLVMWVRRGWPVEQSVDQREDPTETGAEKDADLEDSVMIDKEDLVEGEGHEA